VAPRLVRCLHCTQMLQLRILYSAPFVPPVPLRDPALVN
jgi:hypothetical protein